MEISLKMKLNQGPEVSDQQLPTVTVWAFFFFFFFFLMAEANEKAEFFNKRF